MRSGIPFTAAVDQAVDLLAEKLGVRLDPSSDVQQSAGTPTH